MTDRPAGADHPAGTQRWAPPGGRVERVLLLADGEKDSVADAVGDVVAFLSDHGVAVETHRDVRGLAEGSAFEPERAPELVVVLGGDGSVLTAAGVLDRRPVPTIGINFGRVGFLASLEADGWREGLAQVLGGHALVEQRMRLTARVERADGRTDDVGEIIALNDVVLSRGSTPTMVKFDLVSKGSRVTNYRADGLIFATPSGSTAYSLAAGGPILDPALRAIVVTPISAHALAHRPLVIGPRAAIAARVASAAGEVSLDVDGHSTLRIGEGDTVHVEAHDVPYPLLTLQDFDPWQRLRDRLGWSGQMVSE